MNSQWIFRNVIKRIYSDCLMASWVRMTSNLSELNDLNY